MLVLDFRTCEYRPGSIGSAFSPIYSRAGFFAEGEWADDCLRRFMGDIRYSMSLSAAGTPKISGMVASCPLQDPRSWLDVLPNVELYRGSVNVLDLDLLGCANTQNLRRLASQSRVDDPELLSVQSCKRPSCVPKTARTYDKNSHQSHALVRSNSIGESLSESRRFRKRVRNL